MPADALSDPPRPSLVAVVAHPDDEVLIAGGTLALAVAAGTPAGVVSLTRGERGPVAPGSLRPGETLALARARELEAAAAELGADWVVSLRRPDGGLAGEDALAVGRELADVLRPRAPSVLLTFGLDGLYGHPDHIATRAIAGVAAGLLDSRPAVLEAVWRPGLVTELVAAAAARDLAVGLWDLHPAAFDAPAAPPALTIDVRSVVALKMRALAAHRTQFAADHLLAGLPQDLWTRFLGDESWTGDGAGLRSALTPAAASPTVSESRLGA